MPHLFGYGSLLNLASASRSLGRQVEPGDFTRAVLPGHTRIWRVVAPVIIEPKGIAKPVDALFLDVTADPPGSGGCNGVVIEVSEEELVVMDHREKQYTRETLAVIVEGRELTACSYVGRPESFASRGCVLAGYLALLEEALSRFDDSFRKRFWESTHPFPGEVVQGEYVFADPVQSRAAGRP